MQIPLLLMKFLKLEFGIVDEAYSFYYRYGKCKGFFIRKGDVRSNISKKNYNEAVCANMHGLRGKKHLSRNDRKRDHRRLTRINCEAASCALQSQVGRYVT